VNGGKLLVCGNGGSAAMPRIRHGIHLPFHERPETIPALNLAGCGSLLTATGNDTDLKKFSPAGARFWEER